MNTKKAAEAAGIRHDKGSYFEQQTKTVFQCFQESPKTMKQVDRETGIDRANVCRYVAELTRLGQIQVIRKGICPITHNPANFYSTDKRLFTWPDPEPTLFSNL
ncbi:MAG: hypothetical protein FWG54_01665 [Bacteroidetes bacterium]|nr:hypothetical protein [Bacteroidota bacterium]